MSYDALSPIAEFNALAGFDCHARRMDHPDVQFQVNLINEEYFEMLGAFDDGDLVETLDGIADVIVTVAGLAHRLGVDPNELMKEINESNASKFCYNAIDAHMSVTQYADDPRYTDVRAVLQGDVYVIMGRKVNGGDQLKILKGINYKAPNLSKLIQNR